MFDKNVEHISYSAANVYSVLPLKGNGDLGQVNITEIKFLLFILFLITG